MRYIIPDTNILLGNPGIVVELISKNYSVIVPMTVIDELDKLKNRTDVGYKVRA